MTKKIEALINGISVDTLKAFCAAKADTTGGGAEFIPVPTGGIKIPSSNRDIFRGNSHKRFESIEEVGYFKQLGMFVFLVQLNTDNGEQLLERSCRRLQFDFACDILKSADWVHQHTFTDWLANKGEMVGKVSEGLFVFADSNGNFRFSYIQNVNRANDNVPRRFRRFTFYVTARNDRSNRTFTERMKLPWPDAAALAKAFSVQALSDEFFSEYKRIYSRFVAFCMDTPAVRQQFAACGFADDKSIRDYVKKLMGRLVFLQFLEKKRWLGVPEGGQWGEGEPDYLRNLFNAKHEQNAFKDNFLDKVLEPLFFDSLNAKRTDDLADAILAPEVGEKVRIPYLNGGLFEKTAVDEVKIPFPDAYFEDLFDTFDRFNFTIDENGPEDAEIGVDPEMLSRIFENLLEDNKDKGAFYTPKEIVDYMCKESLIAYLGETPAVRELVENYASNDALDAAFTESEKAALLKKLADVKICDPAIGSGAFPMGMLAILCRLRLRLEGKEETSTNIVSFKKEIIQNNIYGVDIEAGAVDIARLRFWLSIVVDENEPIPLPNLDYKIMQGNSLLESFMGVDLSKINPGEETILIKKSRRGKGKLVTRKVAIPTERNLDLYGQEATTEEIFDAIAATYNETDHKKRDEYRNLVYRSVSKLIEQAVDASENIPVAKRAEIKTKAAAIRHGDSPFMLWHLFFAEAFKNGGFDIVIGNPPYIQLQARKGLLSALYKDAGFDSFFKMGDIYCLFYEQAFNISRKGAVVAYITPNTWLQSLKFDRFRKYMLNAGDMFKALVVGKVFEATVDTNVFVFEVGEKSETCHVDVRDDSGHVAYSHDVEITDAHRDGGLLNIVAADKSSSLAERIIACSDSFGSYFEISTGVKPFQVGKGKPKQTKEIAAQKPFVVEGENPGRGWMPLMRGSLMGRYINRWNKNYWILYGEWLAEPRNPKYFNAPEKLIIRQTGDRIVATILEGGVVCRDNLYVCLPLKNVSMRFALAVANSALNDFVYTYLNPEKGEALAQVKRQHVAMLPYPKNIDSQIKIDIEALVDRILAAKKQNSNADTSALEEQIDDLVYDLYGLTEEERAIVDPERFGQAAGVAAEAAEGAAGGAAEAAAVAGASALPVGGVSLEDDGADARD